MGNIVLPHHYPSTYSFEEVILLCIYLNILVMRDQTLCCIFMSGI